MGGAVIRRLPWRLCIAAEVLLVYVRVRLKMRHADIRDVAAALREAPRLLPPDRDPDPLTAAHLGRAVYRVLAFAPSRSRCLVQSLVLTRMLSRRGIDSALVIGVTAADGFAAHAWVEKDGIPLLPPLASRYVPLVRV